MAARDIIVIGGSAGGVEALKELAAQLSPQLNATIFIVIHISPHSQSVMPQILSRAGVFPAQHPTNNQHIQPGNIYVAPPNHHLLVIPDRVQLTQGPKENGHRPSVDVLFRTAARAYGARVIGVVLTGALDDGSSGIVFIKEMGGVVIAQDPDDALYSGMPQSAIQTGKVDHIVRLNQIAPLLLKLTQEQIPQEQIPMEDKPDISELENGKHMLHEPGGTPSTYVCPDCGGVMMEYQDGEMFRFRCQVGHGYSAESMLMKQTESVEDAIWMALRTLEENASLNQRLAERAGANAHTETQSRFIEKIRETEQRAAVLRRLLLQADFYTEMYSKE